MVGWRPSARLRADQNKIKMANNIKNQQRQEWENVGRGAFPLVAGRFLGPSVFDSRPAGRPLDFIRGCSRWDGGLSENTAFQRPPRASKVNHVPHCTQAFFLNANLLKDPIQVGY